MVLVTKHSDPHGSVLFFSIDSSGNWDYDLDNSSVQGLAAGETATDSFTVTATTADG